MSEISQLGYIVIGTEKKNEWKKFSSIALGLQTSKEEDDVLFLRMDSHYYRVIIESGAEDLKAAGWQFENEEGLLAYVQRVREQGIEILEGGELLLRKRGVKRIFSFRDPNGFNHEIYFGPLIANSNFYSPAIYGNGFKAESLGVGHILVKSNDYKESVNFYQNILGLKVSDYIVEEIAPGIFADATFFHATSGRHHSLATGKIPGEKILNHFMIEVTDINDVGLAYDRCVAEGYKISKEIGVHPNDKMISFYVQTPSGFSIEYGWGGVVIQDGNWDVKIHQKLSLWGHKRNII